MIKRNDVIADAGQKLMPIEIKSGQTVNRDYFAGLEKWISMAGKQAVSPTLIYGGTNSYSHKDVRVLSWNKVACCLD